MKRCSKCGEEKPASGFFKNARQKDGLSNYCKPCQRAANASWRERNRDKHISMVADWYRANRNDYLAGRRRKYAENPEPVLERCANYRRGNQPLRSATNAVWAAKNAEKVRQHSKNWAERNRHKTSAKAAERRADLLNRTSLLTPDKQKQIKAIYGFAQYLTEKFGRPYHVDHIVPLRGKTCSGLHVPENLRVVSGQLNLSKGAKMDYELVPYAFKPEEN
jgi:hypothetical protein